MATENRSFSREFAEVNGRTTFVKFKSDTFCIGKVHLSFVEFSEQTKKSVHSIDVYVDIKDFLVFANDVLSGKLPALAEKQRAVNAKFPPAAYIKQGGVGAEAAKTRFGRTDGKALARAFKFGVSSKEGMFLLQAEMGPGIQDEKGLIKVDGKPEVRINVQCSASDLKAICLLFQSEYVAYLAAVYSNNGVK